jgi:hypothetical protein
MCAPSHARFTSLHRRLDSRAGTHHPPPPTHDHTNTCADAHADEGRLWMRMCMRMWLRLRLHMAARHQHSLHCSLDCPTALAAAFALTPVLTPALTSAPSARPHNILIGILVSALTRTARLCKIVNIGPTPALPCPARPNLSSQPTYKT